MTLKETVIAALENAKDGGYAEFVLTAPARVIANDLIEHDADVEKFNASASDIMEIVIEWRKDK